MQQLSKRTWIQLRLFGGRDEPTNVFRHCSVSGSTYALVHTTGLGVGRFYIRVDGHGWYVSDRELTVAEKISMTRDGYVHSRYRRRLYLRPNCSMYIEPLADLSSIAIHSGDWCSTVPMTYYSEVHANLLTTHL